MDELFVNGYRFQSKEDAVLARGELNKIEQIKQRLDYNSIEEIYNVYSKAIEKKIFITPIGLTFLHELREYLIQCDYEEDDLTPIPVVGMVTITEPVAPRKKEMVEANKNAKTKIHFLTALVTLLTLAVIVMFVMMIKSNNPTILNYKEKLINHYSSWEDELVERENAVRAKELELKMNEKE